MGPRRTRASARSRPGVSRTSRLAARTTTSTSPPSQTNIINDNDNILLYTILLNLTGLSHVVPYYCSLNWLNVKYFFSLWPIFLSSLSCTQYSAPYRVTIVNKQISAFMLVLLCQPGLVLGELLGLGEQLHHGVHDLGLQLGSNSGDVVVHLD